MNEFIDARCSLRQIDWWTPTLTTSTPTNFGPKLRNIEEEGEKIE